MSMVIWLTLIVFAVFGLLVGLALAKNGVIGYGVGNNYGKHHMQNMGEGGSDTSPDKWDS